MTAALPATPLHQLPVTHLKGVGKQLALKLEKLGLITLQDLLFHLPFRYVDRTRITPMAALQPGQQVVVEGEVRQTNVSFGRRRSLTCKLQDQSGSITLRYYHFTQAQKARFETGATVRAYGETRRGAAGLELYHPETEILDHSAAKPLEQELTPVYPATEGLTQQRIRGLIQQTLSLLNPYNLRELLPQELLNQRHACSLEEALRYLHNPPINANLAQLQDGIHPLQERLAYEELVAHNVSLLRQRQRLQAYGAEALSDTDLAHRLLQRLPFALTGAQQKVFQEVTSDLHKTLPMLRLLQGDVGSGKTIVAALAALIAIGSGKQAAIMAPTEILAEQHWQTFSQWLDPLGINIAFLTGRLKASERRQQLAAILSGDARLVVGTHALFQAEIEFADLGLVVIDEQHRFGVHQRLQLQHKAKGKLPHQLIMTATPIPRTLAMSAYADLDTSIIDELPPGRTPVETRVISNDRREQVIERIAQACSNGKQAYWVCTLIEESETLEAQAAEATTAELRERLPGIRVGLVHGRLKASEKAQVMNDFHAGAIHLLVATTVIEVGVNVPNASLMVIENPERLGLAQLHQLRGRVGRGSQQSYCLLLYNSPLSANGRDRLAAMRQTNNGFEIAEEDLRLRGPGEVLGTRQTGEAQFKIARLDSHEYLLPAVRDQAAKLWAQYPDDAVALISRWLGSKEKYANV